MSLLDKFLNFFESKYLPPFCFNCNEGSCEGCSAHQAYLRDKNTEWDEKTLDKWNIVR